MNVVMLMAGRGTRTEQYGVPKPLIPINGIPMVELAIRTLDVPGNYIFVTREYEFSKWNGWLSDVLDRCKPDSKAYITNSVLDGPACSALLAKESINNDNPLMIVNCDQAMRWDSFNFVSHLVKTRDDGIVVTYSPKELKPSLSYALLSECGHAIEIREKEVISDCALNGFHYWKRGKDFVSSAEKMIRRNVRVNNEFYVAPTYNILIESGMKISTYHIREDEFWPLGVPEDIDKYLESIGHDGT